MVKNSGKKITVYVLEKQTITFENVLHYFQSKIVLLNVDTIYGFAVDSEQKKRIKSETYMKRDLG